MKPSLLGHVHLKVKDLTLSEYFYSDILGLQVTERIGRDFIFLTLGQKHHDLALQRAPIHAEYPPEEHIGLFHFAFELESKKQFAKFYQRLQHKNIQVQTVDYGISKVMYIQDPDGNAVELYVDSRNEQALWEGKNKPLTDKQILSWKN